VTVALEGFVQGLLLFVGALVVLALLLLWLAEVNR